MDLYSNPAGKTQTTTPPQAEKPPTQTVDLQALATAAIRGDYGNGQQRRDALGANYDRSWRSSTSDSTAPLPSCSGRDRRRHARDRPLPVTP